MKLIKEINLDKHDLARLHDAILDVFDISPTNEQIAKLLTLCPDWDGVVDTLGKGVVMDAICKHFMGMKVPRYMDGDDYFNEFCKVAESKKQDVINFIS